MLLGVIYLAFISLGLPDSLLGAAWPTMQGELGVPVSYAGVISMIIAAGTIFSSLQSDRVTRRWGTGVVTAASVATTAVALFGFSFSRSFGALCLWAIPYGLGAGSVDASINNYVALHYASRHMSWLHCMWGIGASAGPVIMGWGLTMGRSWAAGYRTIGTLQLGLTVILLVSLPLWKGRSEGGASAGDQGGALSLREIIALPGARQVMAAFFCYCAIEQTTGLWAGTYLVSHAGLSTERAAGLAGLFYMGITLGRGAAGFLTVKLSDTKMIRLGQGLVAAGVVTLLLPLGAWGTMAGLALVGLGCAPIYPCIIHATPTYFGPERSQAVIGVQMASAYVGTCLMPPVFDVLARHLGAGPLPLFLGALLLLMVYTHEGLVKMAGAA